LSKHRKGGARWLFLLLVLLPVVLFLSLFVGPAGPVGGAGVNQMDFSTVLNILTGRGAPSPGHVTIVMDIRLPRVLMGALVGAALAVAGAAMQGLFRNPMADPYIIGISSGAGLGAAVAILMGFSVLAGAFALPVMAFTGALGTLFLVYSISIVKGRVETYTLLLAGIAVGSFLSALTGLLMTVQGGELRRLVFWMLGGLNTSTWASFRVSLPAALAGMALVMAFSRELNAVLFGEEEARSLGVDTASLKRLLFVGVALLAGVAVAFCGIIGFVGLIVPHMLRLVVGPDHRRLLPASALGGASFLVLADAFGRVLIPGHEIPVGIITALCGAPFFIYLLRRRRRAVA